jgi:hypothetical protein
MAIRNGNDEVLQVRQDTYPSAPNQSVSLFSLFAHGFHTHTHIIHKYLVMTSDIFSLSKIMNSILQ